MQLYWCKINISEIGIRLLVAFTRKKTVLRKGRMKFWPHWNQEQNFYWLTSMGPESHLLCLFIFNAIQTDAIFRLSLQIYLPQRKFNSMQHPWRTLNKHLPILQALLRQNSHQLHQLCKMRTAGSSPQNEECVFFFKVQLFFNTVWGPQQLIDKSWVLYSLMGVSFKCLLINIHILLKTPCKLSLSW